MRKAYFLCCLFCVVIGLSISGSAAFTPISSATWDDPSTYLAGEGGILDILYGWENLTRVEDSPLPGDQLWQNLNGGGTAIAKYAGHSCRFGYFSGTSGIIFHDLFGVLIGPYQGFLSGISGSWPSSSTGLKILRFALRDTTSKKKWSSRQSDNTGSRDHMVSWEITGNYDDPSDGYSWSDNTVGNYVLAWEDLDLGDADYQDLVVEVHGAAPIPEGSTLLFFGSGLCGLLFFVRRKGLIRS